jgi:DNA-binding XRE family transcriptional regulator
MNPNRQNMVRTDRIEPDRSGILAASRSTSIPNTAAIRRTGGAYSLTKAFKLLDISPSHGHALIAAGKIRVVRNLGPASPKITDKEIARLLGEESEASETGGAQAKRPTEQQANPTPAAAFNAAFCQRVAATRRAAGLTQLQVADALGMPQRSYQHFEGRSPLPVHLIMPFADLVGADVRELLNGE